MRAILIEGGSTAYGMDASDYGGWAAQLHRDAQKPNEQRKRDPLVVINHALPGLTLAYFNKNFFSTLPPAVEMCRRRAARILSVGINEAKIPKGMTRPVISLGRFATELAKYSGDSESLRIPTIYVGSQPVDEERTNPVPHTGSIIEDDLLAEYDAVMHERAVTDGMPYVDVRSLFADRSNDLLAEDGYHPGPEGHQVIYEGIRSALLELPTLL